MRPEPIQLKPGTISGLVRPPVRISAAPETMLIMPSVTISGLSFSRVAKRPLIAPMKRAEQQRGERRDPDVDADVAVENRDQHADQPGDGGDREVEPAGDDERRAGRRHQADEGDVRADRHHVAEREEERREQRRRRGAGRYRRRAGWRRPTRAGREAPTSRCRAAEAGWSVGALLPAVIVIRPSGGVEGGIGGGRGHQVGGLGALVEAADDPAAVEHDRSGR